MWENVREFFESLGDRDGGHLRDFAIGLLGGIARLAYDHRKYDGIGLQFWYGLFRTVAIVMVMVTFTRATVDTFCVGGASSVAMFSGGCFFAYEILYIFKRTIKSILEGYIKGFLK